MENELKSEMSRGVTLIEVIVSVVIIAIFFSILIANFPRMQKQFALTRVVYKLAQDIREVQDMGFSGVALKEGEELLAKGYGIYFDYSISGESKKYIIYADRGEPENSKFDNTQYSCFSDAPPTSDCILEEIDITQENKDIYIKSISNIMSFNFTSVNFSPPNPKVTIDNLALGQKEIQIKIGLLSDPSFERWVSVNSAGLITVGSSH